MNFVNFLQWLSETQFSEVIRGTVWAEPIVETIHILTLSVFLGFLLLLDLRLLGVMLMNQRLSELQLQFNRWLYVSFAVMIVTGLLLFAGDPVSFWSTVFFKAKMILLILSLVNVVIFNQTVGRRAAEWDLSPDTPAAAKVSAIISLVLWVAIVAAGRAIAYALPVPI